MSIENKQHRRKFLTQLGLLSLALPTGTTVLAQSKGLEGANTAAFATAPFLESRTATSCCISIITSAHSFSWIEYGEQTLDQKAYQYSHGLREADATLFKINLKGLKPATPYSYRFVTKAIIDFQAYKMEFADPVYSETYTFKTEEQDPDQCHAIIYNDIHDRPKSFADLWKLKKAQHTDLVFFNGDTFDYQTDEKQLIDHFFKPINALFSTHTPFVMVRGNHETRGKFARNFLSYFAMPSGHTYQAFRKGPVHWIVLDAGEDKPDADKAYNDMVDFDQLRLAQRDWLLEIVQTADYQEAPFRVVVIHIPPLHSGDWHGPMHCQELFLPIFNAHGVDLVLSGHTHRHGLHQPSTNNKFALLIGGGPKEGERTLTELNATNKRLEVSLKSETGSGLYHWSKEK